jgi:lipoprotein-anchoring transpeptidase ErfK/SrfK
MSDRVDNLKQMSQAAKISILAVVLVILGAVGAAFAYDSSKSDEIAPGVRIAGVDVGGHNRDEARSLLQENVVKPLMRPVKVKFDGTTYELTPKSLHMDADIEGMLDEAVAASREGGLPARLVRYATDGSVSKNLAPKIGYDEAKLNEKVDGIVAQIDRDPVDASITPGPDSVSPTPGQDGIAVNADDLHAKVAEALQQGAGSRTVSPQVSRVPPKVTTDQLAAKYPTYLTIDRGGFKLTLWKNLKEKKTYPIAVGQQGLETPAGVYTINDKQVNPTWHVPDSAWAGSLAGQDIPPGPGNPLLARWMGFYNGAGIHGTNEPSSIGSAASHGCVRMLVDDVIDLYDRVPLGTPIYIGN